MRINTNLSAMTALNSSTKTTALASSSMEKLSSGLRINSASDDAAGLAISEKMRSQIRGLDQASKNAQDGISVVQTAEGAMEEIGNIAQRMRELTVQASNETNSVEDREKITTELSQLHSEIDRISESTQFNGKKLLASGTTGEMTINSATAKGDGTLVDSSAISSISGFKDYELNGKEIGLTVTKAASDSTDGEAVVKIGDKEFKATIAKGAAGSQKTVNVDDGNGNKMTITLKADASTTTHNGVNIGKLDLDITNNDLTVTGDSVNSTKEVKGFTDEKFKNSSIEIINDGSNYTMKVLDQNGKLLAKSSVATGSLTNGFTTFTDEDGKTLENHSIKLDLNKTKLDAEITLNGAAKLDVNTFRDDLTINLQIGANTGDSEGLKVNITNGSTKSLGIDKADIEALNNSNLEVGTESAKNLVNKLDKALEQINTSRANLGAVQNRLETAQSNLTTSSENLTAAESRIRDVDVAAEMMNLSKLNLINQAAQAMMTQAKSQPEGVMQLLR